ncbi:hypothetical protein X759_26970 [Mesorhizobium sp. LSHC420B00]|nr:hypothetical protein X759_26970 [Mesorhizobium sp. LSHC420B00]
MVLLAASCERHLGIELRLQGSDRLFGDLLATTFDSMARLLPIWNGLAVMPAVTRHNDFEGSTRGPVQRRVAEDRGRRLELLVRSHRLKVTARKPSGQLKSCPE